MFGVPGEFAGVNIRWQAPESAPPSNNMEEFSQWKIPNTGDIVWDFFEQVRFPPFVIK